MSSINLRLAMVVLVLLCGSAAFRAADEKNKGAGEEKRLLGEWVGTYQGGKAISLTFGPKKKVTLSDWRWCGRRDLHRRSNQETSPLGPRLAARAAGGEGADNPGVPRRWPDQDRGQL